MGQRVEVPIGDAGHLTQRPRVLEHRGDVVIVEMPDVVGDVDRRKLRRIVRRFKWLLGQRWRPEEDD